MKPYLNPALSQKIVRWETVVWCLGVVVLCTALKSLLFFRESTLFHDNFYWNFPVFHFFAVSLMQGSLPLWDPYTSGGQPFYPLLVQFRLLEPIAILTVLVGKIFTSDTATLFHWTRFLESLWMSLGSYLLLRRYTPYALVRFILIPLLLFSSFFLASFRQDGIISQFIWAPWVLLLLVGIFYENKRSWFRWIALGFSIGINFQSYFFVGVSLLVLLFLVHSLLLKRSIFPILMSERWKSIVACAIVVAMVAPNLALLYDSKHFTFPLRMLPSDYKTRLLSETGLPPAEAAVADIDLGIRMDYEALPFSGAFTKVWEWLQIVHPAANPNIFMTHGFKTFGKPAEAYFYLGLITFIFGLIGVFYGRHEQKTLWLFLLSGFGLLMLGPPGGLHRLLYPIFPPLWFLRHTDLLNLYFVLCFFYFFVLGMNFVLESRLPQLWLGKKNALWMVCLSTAIALIYVGASKLEYPIFKFPETNWLFLPLFAVAVIIYFTGRLLGVALSFWSLIFGHFAAVWYLAPQRQEICFYWMFFLVLPVLCIRWGKGSLGWLILVFCLGVDLAFSFNAAEVLYSGMPHPRKTIGSSLEPKKVGLEPISLQPSMPIFFAGHQSPRYMSLLYQHPYALSGRLFPSGDQTRKVSVAEGIKELRWNSYLLLKNYHVAINSDRAEEWIPEAFRLGKFPIAWYRQFPQLGISSEEISLGSHGNRLSANELHIFLNTESNGFLYWADGFDPWWTAEMDGKKVPVHMAMMNFKAVKVDAGSHDIRFRYRPMVFLIALVCFYGIPIFAWVMALLYSAKFRITQNREVTCPA